MLTRIGRTREPAWVLAIIAAGLLTTSALADAVRVGSLHISLPEPRGLQEVLGPMPDIRPFAETFVPETNRLLTFYTTAEVLSAWMSGQDEWARRYAQAQVYRAIEDVQISPAEFQRQISTVRQDIDALMKRFHSDEMPELLDRAASKLRDLGGIEVHASLGEPVPLGIILDQADAFTNVTMTPTSMNVGGTKRDFVMLNGTAFVYVRGRILFLYVYSEYEDQLDIDWIRDVTTSWVEAVLAANATREPASTRVTGTPASTVAGSIDWDRVVGRGVIGAFTGGLIALFAFGLRRKND